MKECSALCVLREESCEEKGCRMWIDYPDEYNCSLVSVAKNGNMTLEQVGERLGISFVRVKQLEDQAKKKLSRICNKTNFFD